MNRKHRKTIEAINTKPTKANISFSDIEKLLIALGGKKIEGRGSRVAFVMPDGSRWEAHRPHPQKEARKYQVDSIRDFLELIEL